MVVLALMDCQNKMSGRRASIVQLTWHVGAGDVTGVEADNGSDLDGGVCEGVVENLNEDLDVVVLTGLRAGEGQSLSPVGARLHNAYLAMSLSGRGAWPIARPEPSVEQALFYGGGLDGRTDVQ